MKDFYHLNTMTRREHGLPPQPYKFFQHLRANNLVMWEAIKWSCEKKFQSLSFGRTEPENKGLMQFKAGWGVKPYEILFH